MNETAPLPCDSMVVSTSGDTANQSPVCVMHLPSVTTDTSQAAGTPCNVIADVVQVSGAMESSNVTYVNVSSTTNPLRVGDLGAGVGVGSIDTVGGTHVDVVLVPAIACTDGLFRCDYCKYTTDKKANWYKHKIHHTGYFIRHFFRTFLSLIMIMIINIYLPVYFMLNRNAFWC